MNTAIAKFKKLSATQLIERLEKGKLESSEKAIVIQILRSRGRDVTPYLEETSAEEVVKASKEIDKSTKEKAVPSKENPIEEVEEAKPVKEKVEKLSKKEELRKRTPKVKREKKETIRVAYEDANFKPGAKVLNLKKTKNCEYGEMCEVVKTYKLSHNEEYRFAVLKNAAGKNIERKFDAIEKVNPKKDAN